METERDIPEGKPVELANERALARLIDLQRIGNVGDWEWDFATEAITWSPQVFEIFGRDPCLGPPPNYEENANGRGIRAVEATGIRSLGLLGLRKRARAAGRSGTIQGRPSGGASGAARIPIVRPGKSS
jgi:hypothetical protein